MALTFTSITSENASELCPVYIESPSLNQVKPDEAVIQAKIFRSYTAGDWPFAKTRGYYIPKAQIDKIIAQDPATILGFKVYFGVKISDGIATLELILVGTDSAGNDFGIPTSGTSIPSNIVFGETRPCPIHCGRDNALNKD